MAKFQASLVISKSTPTTTNETSIKKSQTATAVGFDVVTKWKRKRIRRHFFLRSDHSDWVVAKLNFAAEMTRPCLRVVRLSLRDYSFLFPTLQPK